jgi:DNA-binding GntR family transcriptional regulator
MRARPEGHKKTMPEPAKPETLVGEEPMSRVEWVYSRLRTAIVHGELEPGSPLRYGELSRAFGVSLIPIREAVRKLEMEKLIETEPNKGAWIAPITEADVRDVYAMRTLVEGYALRRAVPNLDPSRVDDIRAIYAQMLALGRRDDPAYYDLHHRLHFSLYEPCESPWAMHIIKTLWGHTERHRRLAARDTDFAIDLAKYDNHGVMIDCAAAGDADGAEEALRRDLSLVPDIVIGAYATNSAKEAAESEAD